MTQAKLGALSQLKMGDGGGSPEVFTKIAEILSIGEVGEEAPEVPVTNLDSTRVERIAGLPDGSAVQFSGNWIAGNTQQQAARAAVGTTRNFQIVWPDGTQADFAMAVLGFMMGETTPGAQMTFSVSGRITGDIAWS